MTSQLVHFRSSSRSWRRTAAAASTLLALGIGAARADEAVRWNRIATDAAAAAGTDPLTESRWFAILHIAIHDTANLVEPRFELYGEHGSVRPRVSLEAAVASAAHAVLVELMPASRAAFDQALAETLGRVPDGAAERGALELGERVARDILAGRADDGAARTVAYAAGTGRGEYRPTPPDLTPAFLPQWGSVVPFALRASAQFRPDPPPAPGSPAALADLAEVREVGGAKSAARTATMTEIAKYWYENSSQGWNRIARAVVEERQLDPLASARLLALVNIAMADGFIGGFEAKYHYRYWRPVTAIREAGEAEWLSELPTPPVPDHPSTHTVLGAAAASAMACALGTDFVEFSMTSGAPYPGLERRFCSLSQAAWENGLSRVLAGIHFRSAVVAGYQQGNLVGAWACENTLRPLDAAMKLPGERTAAAASR
jgi:hypothetical protein